MKINEVPVQSQLVSGTNIKTINSTSLLGSGNIVVGGASGIHGFLKQSPHGVTANITGTPTVQTGPQTNTMVAYPLILANDYTFNSIEIYCTTAAAVATCRVLIYSNLNSNPDQKLYESATIDLSTTGIKTIISTITLTKGTIYWLVLHGGVVTGTCFIRAINGTGQLGIGYRSNLGFYNYIQTTTQIPLGSAPTTFPGASPGLGQSPLIAFF